MKDLKAFIQEQLDKILNNEFFIVEIKINERNDKIQIFLDKFKNGITLKDCEIINRKLREEIEQIKEDFQLEVSSPGLTKPLSVWQQYYKNKGKDINIITKDGQNISANIIDADNQIVRLLNNKTKKEFELNYNQIKKATLVLDF